MTWWSFANLTNSNSFKVERNHLDRICPPGNWHIPFPIGIFEDDRFSELPKIGWKMFSGWKKVRNPTLKISTAERWWLRSKKKSLIVSQCFFECFGKVPNIPKTLEKISWGCHVQQEAHQARHQSTSWLRYLCRFIIIVSIAHLKENIYQSQSITNMCRFSLERSYFNFTTFILPAVMSFVGFSSSNFASFHCLVRQIEARVGPSVRSSVPVGRLRS